MAKRGLGWATAAHALLTLATVADAPRSRRPESAIAWILLVALFPVGGFVLFLLIGGSKLPRGRQQAQRTMDERIGAAPPYRSWTRWTLEGPACSG